MEEIIIDNKKQSILKALLFSALVMLGGAVVWGVVYAIGVFSAWIAFASTMLAVFVYLKFYNKIDWKAYVWVISITLVLNVISLFVTLAIVVAIEAQASLGDSFKAIFEMIKELPDVQTAIVMDMVYCTVFTILGTFIAISSYKKKMKVQAEQDKIIETTIVNENTDYTKYDQIISELQEVVKAYMSDRDKELFNNRIGEIKTKYADVISSEELALLKVRASQIRKQDNTDTPERAVACDIIQNQF